MAVAAGTCIICGIPAVSASDNICSYCLRQCAVFETQTAFDGIDTGTVRQTAGLAVQTMYNQAQLALAQAIAMAPNATPV